jgi:molybdopterin biosynthesis enzyme
MIRQMLGRKNLSHRVLSATLVGEISSTSGLRSFYEALISHENEVLRATPVAPNERGDANGLIVIDEKSAALKGGSEVSVILFDRRAE